VNIKSPFNCRSRHVGSAVVTRKTSSGASPVLFWGCGTADENTLPPTPLPLEPTAMSPDDERRGTSNVLSKKRRATKVTHRWRDRVRTTRCLVSGDELRAPTFFAESASLGSASGGCGFEHRTGTPLARRVVFKGVLHNVSSGSPGIERYSLQLSPAVSAPRFQFVDLLGIEKNELRVDHPPDLGRTPCTPAPRAERPVPQSFPLDR